MTRETKELRHHHPNDFYSVRYFDSGQALNHKDIREVVHHTTQVVDAIRVGNECMPGLSFSHFLCAAMVIANIGYGIDDLLTVKLQHYTQYAVSARMLRPKICLLYTSDAADERSSVDL